MQVVVVAEGRTKGRWNRIAEGVAVGQQDYAFDGARAGVFFGGGCSPPY